MDYLILGAIVLIAVLLVMRRFNTLKVKNEIDQIRENWGKPKDGPFYFERITRYADIIRDHDFHRLPEQTIDDVDIYGLFAVIDRTNSRVGQQYLFKRLIEPANQIKDPSADLIELFTKDARLREEIQLALQRLSNTDAYNIPSLLQDRLIERPKWLSLLLINIVIMVAMIIMSFSSPVFLIALVFPFAVNMIVHYWNKTNALQFISSFPPLNALIDISKYLSKKDKLLYDKRVEKSAEDMKSFQVNNRFINIDNGAGLQGELNLLATYLAELMKAFFLVEVFTFFKVIKELETKRASIITLFDYVGKIDAAISVISLRSGNLRTCLPVFIPGRKEVIAKNLYHPIIKGCQKNSLIIKDKSVLITGSNMSGKSTFLRTLAINSICAQTIYTCFADEFISPVFKQFSSIRIDDSVIDGKSYYFQEVKVMASLVEESQAPHQNLFILDEVFKGTNTQERVSAAKAILSYLNRNNNIVIVSTHDIELSEMLREEYDLYHFTDTIKNDELHFDYLIKPGQLMTRNAIRILELSGYPEEIVNEARKISSTIQSYGIVK